MALTARSASSRLRRERCCGVAAEDVSGVKAAILALFIASGIHDIEGRN